MLFKGGLANNLQWQVVSLHDDALYTSSARTLSARVLNDEAKTREDIWAWAWKVEALYGSRLETIAGYRK